MLTDRRILWHPRGESQFVVGSSGQVALFQWDESSNGITHAAASTDLSGITCLAWSPYPSCDDLVAVGTDVGRVDLLRLSLSATVTSSNGHAVFPSPPVASFAPRGAANAGQRACNAIAFTELDCSLMVCAMERSKGVPGLIVWDIESAAPILGLESRALSSPLTPLPRASLQKSGDARIIQPHGLAEGVTAVSFLPESSRLLATAIGGRWLRLYDLRAPTTTSAALMGGSGPRQGTSKGILELTVDPLDSHRLATFGEDVTVRIWDSRGLNGPVLTFSYRDAAGDGAEVRQAHSLAGIQFSSSQRGLLATLEADKNSVRFWDLIQGCKVGQDHETSPNASDTAGSKRSTGWKWMSNDRDSAHASSSTTDEQRGVSHLAGTHKSRTFTRNLASFTFVPGTRHAHHVVGVSGDGDIEFSVTPKPHLFTWSSRGELGIELDRRWRVYQPVCDPSVPPPPPSAPPEPFLRLNDHSTSRTRASPAVFGRGDSDGFPALTPDVRPRSTNGLHSQGPIYSPAFKNIPMERPGEHQRAPGDLTPRPTPSPALPRTNSDKDLSRRKPNKSPAVISNGLHEHARAASITRARVPSSQRGSVRVVRDDISVVMRRRVLQGYGLENFATNGLITKDDPVRGESMAALWKWMEQHRKLFPEDGTMFYGFDFSFVGLLAIWEGFEPSSFADSPPAPPAIQENSSLLEGAAQSDSPTGASNMLGQFWGGETYPDIVARINESHGRSALALEKVMVPTGRLQQRRLALAICGWELDEERLDARIKEFSAAGEEARAACWLMFTNQHSRALEVLGNSRDERHRIMSGTLAALLPPNPERRAGKERLQTVSLRLEDPYMRVMLLYAAFADWDEVVLEGALPLEERLAIAFCFLDDRSLTSYLRMRTDSYKNSAEIEGLMLTGLSTPSGLSILDSYVDVVGDVQTTAILSSHVVCPPVDDGQQNLTDDDALLFERAEAWAEAYRGLLDAWHLFEHRCRFDIARGELLSETQGARGSQIDAPYPWVPAQLRIRCNTCKRLLDVGADARSKGMQCPTCKKALPRCVICMLGLEVPPEDVRGAPGSAFGTSLDTVDQAFIFCQTCRHGGHASHVLEWFFGNSSTDEENIGHRETHDVCAAGECECRCADLF